MCVYCEGECPEDIINVRTKTEQTDVYVDIAPGVEPSITMEVAIGGYRTYRFAEINHCPMCGRDLRGGIRD